MDSARNIIFITCLLSGICYSNAQALMGNSYFPIPNAAGTPITIDDIVRKLAEEVVCGDSQGWASYFRGRTITYSGTSVVYRNPCGEGKCILSDDMTDYTCECNTGFRFKKEYNTDPDSRTCIQSRSLVTCQPGTRRVAADKLIVGRMEGYEWVSGTYERKAGMGYDNENDVEQIRQVGNVLETRLQQYRHDVPLKGREFYEQYQVDSNCNLALDSVTGNRIVTSTLSFNYKKNQWQFTNLASSPTPGEQVSSKEMLKCVEDVTDWSYTYTDIDSAGVTHLNRGMRFVDEGTPATDFQIRDTEAPDLSTTLLDGIRIDVEAFKYPGIVCPAGSYLRT